MQIIFVTFSQKLRRVLRKALDVSEKTFRKTDLLNELSFRVAEMLGETYPELHRNLKQVRIIKPFSIFQMQCMCYYLSFYYNCKRH